MRAATLFIIFPAIMLLQGCASSKKAGEKTPGENTLLRKYAKRMDVPVEKLGNKTLYRFVEEWRGTDYEYGGQSKDGVDCSGLANRLYDRVYRTDLPRTTDDIHRMAEPVEKKSQLREGDLVFFRIQDKNKVSHLGIYLRNGRFVHASSSTGVVISKLRNPYYRKHFAEGGRLKLLGRTE